MLPPLPRCSSWVYSSLFSPSRISLPRFHGRVGLHIVLFEVCSAFTHVAACTLAQSPIRDRYPGASDISSPPCLLRLLPAGANRRVGLAPTGKRRLVTANRPILYCAISISYDIISKFWPIWSAGPRAAARHFALRRGGRLFLRVGCAARNLAMPITLSTSTMELAGPLSLLQLATTTTAVW